MSLMRIIAGSIVATVTAVIAPVVTPYEYQPPSLEKQEVKTSSSFARVVSLEKSPEPDVDVCLIGLSIEGLIYEISDPMESCHQYLIGDYIPLD